MNERIFAMAHYADMAVLYLLIVLALVSVVMIIERYFVLRQATLSSKTTRTLMAKALANRDLSVVESIARDSSTLEGRAAAHAMEHLRVSGTSGIEEIFQSHSSVEKPKLERSLGFLATVGSNAPYIGLFGTVLGIMKASEDMSKATDAGQSTVMAGISAALIATAAGLMVAIPAVLAYNYFQKQVKTVMGSMDTVKDMVLAYGKSKGDGHGS